MRKLSQIIVFCLIWHTGLSGPVIISDNFDDGVLDTTIWTPSGFEDLGSSFVESGGRMNFVIADSWGFGESRYGKLSLNELLPYSNFRVSFDMQNLVPYGLSKYPEFSFGISGYDTSEGNTNRADFAMGVLAGGSYYYSSWYWDSTTQGNIHERELFSDSVHVEIDFASNTDTLRLTMSAPSGDVLERSISIGSDSPVGVERIDWGLDSDDELGLYFLVYNEGSGANLSDLTLDNFEVIAVPEPNRATLILSVLVLILLYSKRHRTSRWS